MSDPFTLSGPIGGYAPASRPVSPSAPAPRPVMPQDFVYETEHPVMPVPFKATIGETKLEGVALSVTAAYVAISGPLDPAWKDHRSVIKLQFDFDGFTVTLFPEAVVTGSRREGEMTLQFMDPAGKHLPQLRYILNSFIAGDFVSMGGMLNYSGPTKPKGAKGGEERPSRLRIRSLAVGVMSLTIIAATAGLLFNRATQTIEPRPVFIERLGKDMRATTAGQVAYLNPDAKQGEVVFSINSNAGDVLNFQLPCDCEVTVTEGIFEGATVLPIDVILSFFDSTVGVRVQTQMSIEGLGKAVNGDLAYLDLNDGRTIPVQVLVTSATNAAAAMGDLFVPVTLVPTAGDISVGDIGKAGQLRLQQRLPFGSLFNTSEAS